MDLGEIFVNLTFKTPGDYNDIGLAYPGYEKYNSSIFSGRYKVIKVKNTFSGGKFEQELELIYQSMLCTNAFEIERLTHMKFANQLIFGEWYEHKNPQEIIDYIENNLVELHSDFSDLKDICNNTSIVDFLNK
jgi:hypothetical protein